MHERSGGTNTGNNSMPLPIKTDAHLIRFHYKMSIQSFELTNAADFPTRNTDIQPNAL